MRPYHLQIEIASDAGKVNLRWFGASAIRFVDSVEFPLRTATPTVLRSGTVLIDLRPLMAEIAAGKISDQQPFQAADEFLPLQDLLADDDLESLCETLYHFLWRESQEPLFETVRGREPGRVWADPDRRLVRVWFATNRQPIYCDDVLERFSFAESADELTYGVCNVFIPQSHQPGSIGTAWWRRLLRLAADDTLRVYSTHALPADVFWAGMASRLDGWWDAGQRNMFVFIHGYNVGFDQAAIRAAQIGFDLKIPGEMAFFSWPSHGSMTAYSADEATIEASIPHIARFLHELSERSGAERIHVFVHSMGNRGFLRALERIAATGQPTLRLGQVFFCAPDEDVRAFQDRSTSFPHHSENRTVLVSPQDSAVFLSQWKHRYHRVGYVPPVTVVAGMDTIEVGGFGLLDLGHGYFASARPVIEDIREAIQTRRPAKDRRIPRAFENHYKIDIRQNPERILE